MPSFPYSLKSFNGTDSGSSFRSAPFPRQMNGTLGAAVYHAANGPALTLGHGWRMRAMLVGSSVMGRAHPGAGHHEPMRWGRQGRIDRDEARNDQG